MKLKITERKYTATDKMKEKIAKKLEKFDKFFGDDADVQVVLSQEKDRETCEVTIFFGDTIFRMEETTKDMYVSMDECIENLKKQIRKHKTKLSKRIKTGSIDDLVIASAEEDVTMEDEDTYDIVRRKQIPLKPVSVGEAILQMELVGHQFYMFLNADTNLINVVYIRKDGSYGLLEPSDE